MPVASSPVQDFLSLLRGVREDGQGKWIAFCPLHEADGGSHSPSLHIADGDQGCILHCFVCGKEATPRIVHAAGSTMAKLFPQREGKSKNKKSKGRRVAEYNYRDDEGIVVYRAERWEKDGEKTFTQSRPNGHGGWTPGVKGIQRVLYRLPELIAAPPGSTVFIVEGEKKVESLVKWGLIATCNVGGAGKWSKKYSNYLSGHDVVILPDNDPVNLETGKRTGYEHACDVIAATKGIAKSIRILELPGLPPKGDIVDWIAAGGTLPQLLKLLEEPIGELPAVEIRSTKELKAAIQEMDPLDLRLPESRTDVANGRRLVKDHGQDLKYCHPWQKWIVWDGKRWKVDDTDESRRRAIAVADAIWVEMREMPKADIDDATYGKIQNHCKYSSSAAGIAKALECAAAEPGAQILPKQLDADPWLLNCENGTVDLRTGELQEHKRENLLTKISPTNFNIDAESPAWEKFLSDVFGSEELIGYIRRLCGYWSTGIIREQMLPVLFGTGSNGKTTFLNAITQALGNDFCMKAPADFIMHKRNDAHPTDKADLFGKRLVICSETDDGKRLAESMVKELTGDEAIRARRMREDFWEFDPTHKIILVTNHKPMIRGTDHGIWRRIRLIPFARQFWNPHKGEEGPPELVQDDTLKDRLEMEMAGILVWIVRGCIEWHRDGEQTPNEVDDQTKDYRSSQDVLGAFITERCDVDHQRVVQSSDLYKSYRKWTDDNGEYTVNQRQFGLSMAERGFFKYRNNGIWYRGLSLADEMPE